MDFRGVTYIGDKISDQALFESLPQDFKLFYQDINGLVAFHGGLHIRGCVETPRWHALSSVWGGKAALWDQFGDLRKSDIPFAQDCLGDQYFWRMGTVWHLYSESGEVEDLELELFDFLEEVIKDPVDFLDLEPLLLFLEDRALEPGYLLRSIPPFSIEATTYQLEKVPVFDRLADFKR